MGIGHQLGLLDQTVFGGENYEAPFLKLAHREKRRDFFTGFQIEQIDDRLAARRPARLRQFVDFDPIHLADGGEEENVGVHRRDEQRLDKILFLGRGADLAFAAAPLCPVERHRIALDITFMGDRHRHVFVDDHILDGNIFRVIDNLRAPLIAIIFLDLFEFADDDFVDLFLVGEDGAQFGDQLDGLAMLLHDLVALQTGQTLQTQVEDRLSLQSRSMRNCSSSLL